MSNKDILEKAIQKAIDGEWLGGIYQAEFEWLDNDQCYNLTASKSGEGIVSYNWSSSYDIIFNHDFAKAIFGKNVLQRPKCGTCGFPRQGYDEFVDESKAVFCPYDGDKLELTEEYVGRQPWITHLQKMVIADDPIKYLGEHLDG